MKRKQFDGGKQSPQVIRSDQITLVLASRETGEGCRLDLTHNCVLLCKSRDWLKD